jgi:hypothetical protein
LLPAWLHRYNHHRSHIAPLGGRSPVARVNNLPWFYSYLSEEADMEGPGALTQEIHWMPAWGLAKLVASGQLSARELCSTILERISRHDGAMHSFVTVTPEQALTAAAALDESFARGERSGAFHGVPYSANAVRASPGSIQRLPPTMYRSSSRKAAWAGGGVGGRYPPSDNGNHALG